MKLTEIQFEAVLELEKLADKYKTANGKRWALAIKKRPDLHLIIDNRTPRALARDFTRCSRRKAGLCYECGLEKLYRSGLCKKHFNIRFPKNKISELFEVKFQIDNIEMEVNKHIVIIRNCKTFKSVKFRPDSDLSVKDRVNQISKELMFFNKEKPAKYKSIFDSLIEALKFNEKLKVKINEFELSSQEYAGSTASGIK